MYLLELITFCNSAGCAALGHMLLIGAFLAATLVVLNLPRVWVWIVDSWSRRVDRQVGD